ncbi:hypothetical protein NUW58_g1157 [Xylaria curta]|uniref:Uncharacterized protein n=1 Tax=Xylaria curta TaxID=42375 RepID=A0ACC1PP19_9PEZI|nr:hypothetical protein NUW58_g1157 [Xylaria curta]
MAAPVVTRIIPVATTFAITMCHFDQLLIFSSLHSTTNVAGRGARGVAPHVMRKYVQGALPIIIVLEFTSYGTLGWNVYHRLPMWKWYSVGLLCFLSHLVNAPYSWRLITMIMKGDEETEKHEKKELSAALDKFLFMTKLRLVFTEFPLLFIVVSGALAGI